METETNNISDRKPRKRVHKYFKVTKGKISKYLAHFGEVTKENVLLKGSKGDLITALEIDTDHLKLAQFKKTAVGLKLLELMVKKISPFTNEETSKVIKNLFNERSQRRKGKLIVSLPRHSTIMRKILLPSTKEDEIEKMVTYQAPKYVPYSEDEITVDYHVIAKRDDDYSEVMLVIAHNEKVSSHLGLLRETDLKPESLRLGSEAICDSYVHNPDSHKHPQDETVALVDVGYSFTNIQIVRSGNLIYARSVALGSSQILGENEGEKCCEELLNEIARTFEVSDREEPNGGISRIVLSGATSGRAVLCEEFKKKFDVPIETLDPLRGLELGNGLADELKSKNNEFSFSTAVGLVLGNSDRRINLLPKEQQKRKRREAKKRELFKTGVLFLCALILASALFYKKIDSKEKYRDGLNEQLELLSPLVENLETMRREMGIIQKELNAGNSVLDVLRELYQTIPPKVSLNLFSFEAGKKVTLKGSSPTMTEVLDLVPVLERSDLFRNVTVQYLNKRQVKDKEFVDFLIQLQLGVRE